MHKLEAVTGVIRSSGIPYMPLPSAVFSQADPVRAATACREWRYSALDVSCQLCASVALAPDKGLPLCGPQNRSTAFELEKSLTSPANRTTIPCQSRS